MTPAEDLPPICDLPSEVIHHILTFLPASSLAAVSGTCRILREHALDDLLWASLVRENVPVNASLNFLANFPSYRSLYLTHYPYWFVPRRKIWFADTAHTGTLLLARFNPRTGAIEAYRVLAEQGNRQWQSWEWDSRVSIHRITPKAQLWLDDPIVLLNPVDAVSRHAVQGWWEGEVRMSTAKERGIDSTFFLSRSIPPQLQDPTMALWPPQTIPSVDRVRNESQDYFQGWGHKPQHHHEISQSTFRVRMWIERVNTWSMNVRMGESVTTYATLPEECYTPTPTKPYQGIWIGDYAGHGCEFLVIMQPGPDAMESTGDGSYVCSGRLEAVKLTGDVNVPRGEYTFIAEDIGQAGLIRVAEEPIFQGARIVKSRGQVAGGGFRDHEFIPSQLILISPDRIAHYWEVMGHIAFYQRLDIEDLLRLDPLDQAGASDEANGVQPDGDAGVALSIGQ